MSVLAVRTVSLWWPFAVCLFSSGRHANVSTRVLFSQLNAGILKKSRQFLFRIASAFSLDIFLL